MPLDVVFGHEVRAKRIRHRFLRELRLLREDVVHGEADACLVTYNLKGLDCRWNKGDDCRRNECAMRYMKMAAT